MGMFMSTLLNSLGLGQLDRRILLVGLDAAGKTTILYKLKLGDTIHTIPTVGFNCEIVQYNRLTFTIWDIGGQEKLRRLWRHYYEGTDAIIFVVDSNDRDRIDMVGSEMRKMLAYEELNDAALLILANKQDLPNSMSASELMQKLELNQLRGRDYYIQSCVATSGDGLYEGLDWLSKTLSKQKSKPRF
mmetsp:Transcript_15607/g.20253  ORF Transcript_15607/g.20253 Transcript_15607/m.20253 type:complete len:188 (+) Transcript_15607:108-671(+)